MIELAKSVGPGKLDPVIHTWKSGVWHRAAGRANSGGKMGSAQESDRPPVLLGFCERRFPGPADVWRRGGGPGANADGGFRSIQALLEVARATRRISARHARGLSERAGGSYTTAADAEPSGFSRIGALDGGST